MKFPYSPRIRYSRSPLVEVICQIRFPPILKIETGVPVDFQEAVRTNYPVLNISRSLELPLFSELQYESPSGILGQSMSYEFVNKEGDWKLVLASNFIALSTFNYIQWEQFKERLLTAIDILVKYYSPSYFTRIGLRYQDVIIRSEIGLDNCPWQDLLKIPILGIFAANDLPSEDFIETLSIFACRLDYADATVRVRHGLARKNQSEELGYLIDADFYTDRNTEIKDAIETLEFFKREAGCFFRWCITETLHQALEPQPIAE